MGLLLAVVTFREPVERAVPVAALAVRMRLVLLVEIDRTGAMSTPISVLVA